MSTCGEECEVYSRVCGYYRPVTNWNKGKREEFRERRTFTVNKQNKHNATEMRIEYTAADIVTGGAE